MATTLVVNDPLFGWFAYGGALTEGEGEQLAVNPRDGLRQRMQFVIPDVALPFAHDVCRLKLELERDGFSANEDIVFDKRLNRIAFTVENQAGGAHNTTLRLSLPIGSKYEVHQDGEPVELIQVDDWDHPFRAVIDLENESTPIELIRVQR